MSTEPAFARTSSDLHAGYGRAEVLHGLTLQPPAPASVITVIGPNGAGKSTLLNALMGVLPARGTDRVRGPADRACARSRSA